MSAATRMHIRASQTNRSSADGVLTERALSNGDARELVFGRYVIDADVSLGAHRHSADTIAYCITGSCSFQVGQDLVTRIDMGPGDYVFIPAGVLHTETTGPEGVELIFARDQQGGETTTLEN